jgi:hypothetical protein
MMWEMEGQRRQTERSESEGSSIGIGLSMSLSLRDGSLYSARSQVLDGISDIPRCLIYPYCIVDVCRYMFARKVSNSCR